MRLKDSSGTEAIGFWANKFCYLIKDQMEATVAERVDVMLKGNGTSVGADDVTGFVVEEGDPLGELASVWGGG